MEEAVPGIPGAVIRRVAQVRTDLPGAAPAGYGSLARPGELLATIPGAGRYYCRDGTTIEAVADEGADPGHFALCLYGTARAALIHQRGEVPLHAASFVPPRGDGAVAIVGPTGAGKSSLGFQLSRRGWRLVADDATRLTCEAGRVLAWPSRDTIKLWEDACLAAGHDVAGLQRVARSMAKYYVPVAAHGDPVELRMVFELSGDCVQKLDSPAQKMALLSRNTFRQEQIRPLGMQAAHLRIVAAIAAGCAFYQLPGDRTRTPDELAALIESLLPG
jgi:hypothetical protein